jgi:hypothetical protein
VHFAKEMRAIAHGAKRPERAPATANAKAAVDRLPDAVRKKLEEMRAIVLGAGRAQSWHRQLPAAANAKTIGDRLPDAMPQKAGGDAPGAAKTNEKTMTKEGGEGECRTAARKRSLSRA